MTSHNTGTTVTTKNYSNPLLYPPTQTQGGLAFSNRVFGVKQETTQWQAMILGRQWRQKITVTLFCIHPAKLRMGFYKVLFLNPTTRTSEKNSVLFRWTSQFSRLIQNFILRACRFTSLSFIYNISFFRIYNYTLFKERKTNY